MKTLKKVLAVAVVSAFTQSAFAYWDSGVDTINKAGVNDGEAILTLWDAASQKSYSQDLGIRYSALYSGAAFNNQSINLDAALSVFGGNFSNVTWNITVANSHVRNGSTNAYAGAGYIYSYQQALTLTAPSGIAGNVNTHWTQIAGYQGNLGMSSGTVANEVRTGTSAGGYQNGYLDDYLSGQAGSFDLVSNSVMNLWFIGFNNAAGTQSRVANLGSVKLDLANNKLVFQSAVTPEVPVPGAVWLMGSALLGLAGVGRSRKQRA